MGFPKLTIKSGQDVPFDAPLRSLVFSDGRYWTPNFSVRAPALNRLAEEGVERVRDLEGWTKEDLQEVKGVGEKTASKLVQAFESGVEEYHGSGWPWKTNVEVTIPYEIALDLFEVDEDEVNQVIEDMIHESGVFGRIQDRLAEKQLETIQKEIEELRNREKELQSKYEELEDG